MKTIIVENYTDTIFSETGDIKNLKNKNLHIVCPAIKKNSFALNYLAEHLQMKLTDVVRLIDMVNDKKEPGCLYPLYTFTLMPEHQAQENLDFYFEEIMKAQEQYFKTETMLFAFDKESWPDMHLVKNTLQNKINEWVNANRVKHLKSCYLFQQ
jgi:hypothetical protein